MIAQAFRSAALLLALVAPAGLAGQDASLVGPDGRAFYVRPKSNPDGSDLALLYDQTLRSTPHPMDEDEDGAADEDPAPDLDGDGEISEAESLRFNSEKLSGRYFAPREACDHPQLGRMEIGGWQIKFWGRILRPSSWRQRPPSRCLSICTSPSSRRCWKSQSHV